jgi:hypothetical protein
VRTQLAGALVAFRAADDPWNEYAPRVVRTTPSNLAADVPIDSVVVIAFSETMDRPSAEAAFSISPSVAGAFSWAGKTMTFTSAGLLGAGASYTVSLAASAADEDGNAAGSAFGFSFTTLTPTGDTRPLCTIETPSGAQSGSVALAFTISDAEGDTAAVRVRYSLDGGQSWRDASVSGSSGGTVGGSEVTGLATRPAPAYYTLDWDSVSDGVAKDVAVSTVRVRITPSGAFVGGSAETADFSVDNRLPPPPGPRITTAGLDTAAVGLAYSATLAATSGAPPYAWDVFLGDPPPGLALAPDGTLSGMPAAAGSFTFAVRVLDANSRRDTREFTLRVSKGVHVRVTDISRCILGKRDWAAIKWQSSLEGAYTVRVGGSGPGSGKRAEAGSIEADVEIETVITEADLPDNAASAVTIYVERGKDLGSAFVVLYDDQAPPVSCTVFPSDGSLIGGVSVIRGTVVDPVGNMVTRLEAAVSDSTGRYWDNGAFASGAAVWHDTGGTDDWSLDVSAVSFADGIYTVYTRGTDAAGNVEAVSEGVVFEVRQGVPAVEIISVSTHVVGPERNALVYYQSDTDGAYYIELGGDGTPGSGTELASGTIAADNAMSISVTPANLPDNETEKVFFIVEETGGNAGHVSVTFAHDRTPPASRVTAPASGETLDALHALRGRAEDSGGSGVLRVEFSLRNPDGYYNGAGFTSETEVWLAAQGTALWSFNARTVPLSDGTYTIRSRAADAVGNVESAAAAVTFTISSAGDPIEPPAKRHPKKDTGKGFCAFGGGNGNNVVGMLLPIAVLLMLLLILRRRGMN